VSLPISKRREPIRELRVALTDSNYIRNGSLVEQLPISAGRYATHMMVVLLLDPCDGRRCAQSLANSRKSLVSRRQWIRESESRPRWAFAHQRNPVRCTGDNLRTRAATIIPSGLLDERLPIEHVYCL